MYLESYFKLLVIWISCAHLGAKAVINFLMPGKELVRFHFEALDLRLLIFIWNCLSKTHTNSLSKSLSICLSLYIYMYINICWSFLFFPPYSLFSAGLLDGVAKAALVDLEEIQLATHLAERKPTGKPFFRNGKWFATLLINFAFCYWTKLVFSFKCSFWTFWTWT